MEQDLRICPTCGAPSSDNPSCRYCGQTPDQSEKSDLDAIESSDPGSAHLHRLLNPGSHSEHLLDQVPEDMRGVLAARLKAAEDDASPSFSKTTASALREQGYVVNEDARGARLTATRGQSDELGPSEVVKLAADLEGGVQPQSTLPICSNCQAASPVGKVQCQWCGEPLPV